MNQEEIPEDIPEVKPESIWTNEDAPDEELRAREIAGKGSYERIQRELENSGLLGAQVARVAEKYRDIFSSMQEVNRSDLEMFTVLELYDEGTANHCIETFRIAREKVEKRLVSGEVLGKLFEAEYVSLDEFFRACLLHDIGKVEVPRFVIQHPMNDHEMDMYLRDLVVEHDPETVKRLEADGGVIPAVATVEELEAYLHENHLRSVHFVPARLVLSEEQVEELEARGFDPDSSLMDIIKTHESRSHDILASAGMMVESELAGLHHNYQGAGSRYPIALSALHISVDIAELLHIADVQQALSATRSYKKGLSRPRVLRIIMEEVARGRISEEAAYLWVEDDLMTNGAHADGVASISDAEDIRVVRTQLEHIRSRLEDSGELGHGRNRMAA